METAHLHTIQQYFLTGKTRSYQFRKEQLTKLKVVIQENETAILQALHSDLGKSAEEAYVSELGFIYAELSHTIKQLDKWMKPKRVGSPLFLFPSQSTITRDPLGVTLLVAPWNYPFHLLIAPLIGVIAGGNCAVLKPSEFSSHTANIIKKIISENFDSEYLFVVTGDGAKVIPAMMNNFRFDHVFFTGSTMVGKEIAKMAAPNLTPVTLELGGKSPCIVDKDVNIKVAAQRIAFGKFTNAGQTCVAPDYLLVHESRKSELLDSLQQSVTKMYSPDPRTSPDYGKIINEQRFDTLAAFLAQGEIVTGGKTSKSDLYIAPTIMEKVREDQPLMQEEIFGPILPVFTFSQPEEAMAMVGRYPNPLALYVFTSNSATEGFFTRNVAFGGGCINNTIIHLANVNLPFGGVGNSGLGQYHGRFSFETFTRPKSILKTATWLDLAAKYPPFKGKLPLLKFFMK